MKRAVASLVVFLLSYTIASALMRPANPSYADLTQQYCPTEWAALNALGPPTYLADLNDQEAGREPGSTPDQNARLHRPFLLAIMNAIFVGNVVALETPSVHTPHNIAQTEAELALLNCLNPTPKERREILQTMAHVINISEAEASLGYTTIFQKTDHIFCMGFDKAFEAIKRLDPSSAKYKQELYAARDATIKICPES